MEVNYIFKIGRIWKSRKNGERGREREKKGRDRERMHSKVNNLEAGNTGYGNNNRKRESQCSLFVFEIKHDCILIVFVYKVTIHIIHKKTTNNCI